MIRMGNETKRSLGDAVKAQLDTARAQASKVASDGMKAAKAGVGAGGDAVLKFAADGAKVARKGANGAIEASRNGKRFVDDKARAALDKEYAAKRELAVANLQRLRDANPECTPHQVFELLTSQLSEVEKKDSASSKEFTKATVLFALTAVELRDKAQNPSKNLQKFVDLMVALDSKAANVAINAFEIVVTYGPVVLLVAARIPGPIGKVAGAVGSLSKKGNSAGAKAAKKFVAKVAWLPALLKIFGVKNPGKKSAAWLVTAVTKKVIGEFAATWGKANSQSTKKLKTKVEGI